jgi:type III pantothenate kinase
MLLAIKMGNSTLCIAKFNNPLEENFSIIYETVTEKLSLRSLNKVFFKHKGMDCIICSVVPAFTQKFIEKYNSIFRKILIINSKLNTGLKLKVKNKEKFGSDRLACCVAAYEIWKENLAIIDAGTATTITVVTNKGEVLGGSIMPGLRMMRYALHEKTAVLPSIEFDGPVSALGVDTESAIRSGIILGTVYALKGIIKEIEKSTNFKLKTILTGGNAFLLSKYLNFSTHLEPYLVVKGMRLIYLKNIEN